MKDFRLGEPVLFCDGWGMSLKPDKIYRWGNVSAGFITAIEEVESRDSKLYTVGTIDRENRTKIHTRLLGSHLIFKLDEMTLAEEAVEKYVEL
jgi:hypothetical protein